MLTNSGITVAIIGSGPSAIYLLKGMLDTLNSLSPITEIHIYEKDELMGMGMPYNPHYTDKYNLANITSEEIPLLFQSFADWLRDQSAEVLADMNLENRKITETDVYSRIALGRYFNAQFTELIQRLQNAGILIFKFPGIELSDIKDLPEENCAHLFLSDGSNMKFDQVYIATGHNWDDPDQPEHGYYQSPWPISKILPSEEEFYNFEIGILGASLSAFDVVTSLAHRHGTFTRTDGKLSFVCEFQNFEILLHSTEGWLPHLQYEQKSPMRKIYRYIDHEGMMELLDEHGFLRIETFFDKVCRRVLQEALYEDGQISMVMNLTSSHFGFKDFVDQMSEKHSYEDPFEGMRKEIEKAGISVKEDKPIYWKEAVDDLMYTLNFHAEYMPAEDHIFFNTEVMPFLMNVIAALPLESAEIMLALYDAGVLNLETGKVKNIKAEEGKVRVIVENEDVEITSNFKLFVECKGDKKITMSNFPFQTLGSDYSIRAARAAFAENEAATEMNPEDQKKVFIENLTPYYTLSGIDIDRSYRIKNEAGKSNPRIIDISFLHTAGLRPYSYGLQACHTTALMAIGVMPG